MPTAARGRDETVCAQVCRPQDASKQTNKKKKVTRRDTTMEYSNIGHVTVVVS